MKSAELEAKLKTLEATIEKLESRLTITEDIEAIKKLQRTYGFYLTHWMGQDIVDLFSDSPDVSLIVIIGEFRGKEGIKKFYLARQPNPELLLAVMQLSGVVDVAPNGKTAKGRWFGFGLPAVPVDKSSPVHGFLSGIYEMDYIKENEVWKFWKLQWRIIAHISPKEGWLSTEVPFKPLDADIPPASRSVDYRLPIHFKNPVTGK